MNENSHSDTPLKSKLNEIISCILLNMTLCVAAYIIIYYCKPHGMNYLFTLICNKSLIIDRGYMEICIYLHNNSSLD